MLRQKLFKEFFFLSAIVGSLNLWALQSDLYWKYNWFDSMMHFLGGALVGSFFLWVYFFSGFFAPEKRNFRHFILIALLGVALVGFSWEIYELVLGEAKLQKDQYLFDTTLDLIMDTLGALAICLFGYAREISSGEIK